MHRPSRGNSFLPKALKLILANEITFEGIKSRPTRDENRTDISFFCVIRKLMIEWDDSKATEDSNSEASGKLMCAIVNKSDGDNKRKNQFIFSFIRTPGSRFQEVLGGADKAIPIPFSSNQNDWQIEKFCVLPYFENGSLNIKNCSLEIEFLKIESKKFSFSE